MLEELSVTDLGVIEAARVEFSDALTVITGETGTGKTMVLTALGLLRGDKTDPALVRVGAAAAGAEGIVDASGNPLALERAMEAGAIADDGRLTVARIVPAQGRPRCILGGRTVPASVLGEVMDDLVVVHGQQDQLRLRTATAQRDALDAFGAPATTQALEDYRARYAQHSEAARALEEFTTERADRESRAETLRFALGEIDRVAPSVDEDTHIEGLIARLAHVEELREASEAGYAAIVDADDEPTAITLVAGAQRHLERVRDADQALGTLADRLGEAGVILSDIGSELASYRLALDADPEALQQAQTRLADLHSLTRKYGPTLTDVIGFREQAAEQLAHIDGGDERLAQLRAELASAEAGLALAADTLTEARAEAAERFSLAVSEELAGLALPGARLQIALEPLDPPGPHGAQDIEFRFSAHRLGPVRPLAKAASGGELSRVMLALEVTLAAGRATSVGQRPPALTMVFDEVDAGVGGRAAIEVGRRLADLADTVQVIVVTHLPQVAAFADRHVVVTKDQATTGVAEVTEVRGEDRLRELARMLAGQQDSDAAQQHAAELLALASKSKPQ